MRRQGAFISFVTLLIGVMIVISGCSNNNNDSVNAHASHSAAQPILVELSVQPMEAEVGEKITFTAKVTHQGADINDAKEVMFEYWRDGAAEENHSKQVVKSSGKGTYVLEAVFQESGDYEVISHVTAMDQHSMPSMKFKVN